MAACELKRNYTTRYCVFAIDNANDLEMLPTTSRGGSGDLIRSTTCCFGSLAKAADGQTYRLNGADEWVLYTPSGGGGGGSGASLSIHVCTADEYDEDTGIPTIDHPSGTTLYLVPNVNGDDDIYDEWINVSGRWEKFGSGSAINSTLSGLSDVNVNAASANQTLIYDPESNEWKNATLNSACVIQDGEDDFILDGGNASDLI